MKDLFGREVTMEEALVMKRIRPPETTAARQAFRIGQGRHPFNGLPLLATPGETCGGCAHHFVKEMSKRYHKCDLALNTNGPASDIRVRWPACELWKKPAP